MINKIEKSNSIYNLIAGATTIIIIIAIWWLLAETTFKRTGIVPTPLETVKVIVSQAQTPVFATAILRTLRNSIISFALAFTVASIFAVISTNLHIIDGFLRPIVTVLRAMPTMALIIILLLLVGSKLLPIVVAFLVVFPMSYENMRAALKNTDVRLIEMAKVFKISKVRKLLGIYIPTILPYAFASIVSGFGLNIKVIIAAEIMGLPTMSIGYKIMTAKQGFDFAVTFAWLVIAVALSYCCETFLRKIGKISMPWKYNDLNNLKSATKRISKVFVNLLGKKKRSNDKV
ncbi:MAG: ABC transporter permease subunit [Christensenellaceae bacterium]|jgi:NitT/TauT family transport system permease protein|nr:ABC transporter permease subunit [Christensenellaceae bacterium]